MHKLIAALCDMMCMCESVILVFMRRRPVFCNERVHRKSLFEHYVMMLTQGLAFCRHDTKYDPTWRLFLDFPLSPQIHTPLLNDRETSQSFEWAPGPKQGAKSNPTGASSLKTDVSHTCSVTFLGQSRALIHLLS